MSNLLNFNPPEGTPLGDCQAQLEDLKKRKLALKIALKNLVVMEELKVVRGEEEKFKETYKTILTQAKIVLKLT